MTTTLQPAPPASVRMAISGTLVERRDAAEVLTIIDAHLRRGEPTGLAVGSVNLDHLHHFRKRTVVPSGRIGWLLLADGMPICWRGQLLTGRDWPRVTGADLLPEVLAAADEMGWRVGFFGGSAESHRLLTQQVRARYPKLVISGMWAPNPDDIDRRSGEFAAQISAARTDILVVSLGKPRQEQWIDRYGDATGSRVFLPFGGAIDLLGGRIRRAPMWMQRCGLEWLYRFSREPRRLARRYLLQGPISLVRASRAQLICYPGVPYRGTSV